MKTVYCISGLGADERIFSKLDVPGVTFTCIRWLQPVKKEPIGAYAARMLNQIRNDHPDMKGDHPDRKGDHPVILGVSFGGMMAIEMAKISPVTKLILVSSVKSRQEMPLWMRLAGKLGLDRLLPANPPRLAKMENNFLGAQTAEEMALCDDFRNNVDPVYLQWAIRQVLNWQNEWQPAELYHIHGSMDKSFPIGRIRPTHLIEGGGHFMIMNRAEEINGILKAIL